MFDLGNLLLSNVYIEQQESLDQIRTADKSICVIGIKIEKEVE
jgi:hypothetical protein